jgi:transposase
VPTLLFASERTGIDHDRITAASRHWWRRYSRRCARRGGCDQLGGLRATATFPTTASGDKKLLGGLRSFGQVERVVAEGTGSYGRGLARYLRSQDVVVIEVSRPNPQPRRTVGKTDVIDAIAAARAVISGQGAFANRFC